MPPVLLTDDGTDGTAFWGSIEGNPMSLVLRTDDPADGTAFWDHVDCATECAGTIAAAVAAERALVLNWFNPAKNGRFGEVEWSDPLGLTTSHSLDPATGIMEIVTQPGVQTANLSEFAGWECQLYGLVDQQSFVTSWLAFLSRLLSDPAFDPPLGTDLEIAVAIMNGPRATADYYYGGAWQWATATVVGSRRLRSYLRRAGGAHLVGSSGGNSTAQAFALHPNPGSAYSVLVRPLTSAGALSSGSTNLQTSINNSTPLSQAQWGTETWLFVGVGRRVGDGVAPNNTALTARFFAETVYTAADWTDAGWPVW